MSNIPSKEQLTTQRDSHEKLTLHTRSTIDPNTQLSPYPSTAQIRPNSPKCTDTPPKNIQHRLVFNKSLKAEKYKLRLNTGRLDENNLLTEPNNSTERGRKLLRTSEGERTKLTFCASKDPKQVVVNYLKLHRANSQAEVREGDVEETAKFVVTSEFWLYLYMTVEFLTRFNFR